MNGIKQQFNEEIYRKSEKLIALCIHNNLRMNNPFFKQKMQHKKKWKNSRGQSWTTNYIIYNMVVHQTQNMDAGSRFSKYLESDHRLGP